MNGLPVSVGHHAGTHPGDAGEPLRHMIGAPRHALPDACMIESHPPAQCGDGADHRFLAGFHGTTDAAALGIGGAHQVAFAGNDACRRPAQGLLDAEQHEIGSGRQHVAPAIFGSGIDNHRHAAGMTGFNVERQGNYAGRRRMVRDDVEGRRRRIAQGGAQLVETGLEGGAEFDHPRPGEADVAGDRRAVIYDMPLLDDDLVLHAGGVGHCSTLARSSPVIAAAAAIVMLAEVQLVTQPASAPVASAMVRLASRWSSAMSTA